MLYCDGALKLFAAACISMTDRVAPTGPARSAEQFVYLRLLGRAAIANEPEHETTFRSRGVNLNEK